MSSDEFVNTFEHAASIVRIRCRDFPGVETILAAIKDKVDSGGGDPRIDRSLFFEPWLDSQSLGVPETTAEEVSRELHQLSVLSIWTRVRCPEVSADEDGTIIETSSGTELDRAIAEMCPHCGTFHELVPTIVETLYAPNFPESGQAAAFESRRLALGKSTAEASNGQLDRQSQRCRAIVGDEASGLSSFAILLSRTLATNTQVESVPSPQQAWASTWAGPVIICLVFLILIGPIVHFAGQATGLMCAIVVILIILAVIRGDTQVKLAPSAACRQVTHWGMVSTIGLITAGTTGFQFSIAGENRVMIPLPNGYKFTLPMKFEFGTVSYILVGAGLLALLLTGTFVLLYDRRLGWFSR